MSRYSGDLGALQMAPREHQHQPPLGCGSPPLRSARLKPVFTLAPAAILTYSKSQMHNLGKACSFNLASSPGQSPLTPLFRASPSPGHRL